MRSFNLNWTGVYIVIYMTCMRLHLVVSGLNDLYVWIDLSMHPGDMVTTRAIGLLSQLVTKRANDSLAPPLCDHRQLLIWFLMIKVLAWVPFISQHAVILDSKVHGTNMEPILGRQDLGGPHVGPVNLAIWDIRRSASIMCYKCNTLRTGILSKKIIYNSLALGPAATYDKRFIFLSMIQNGKLNPDTSFLSPAVGIKPSRGQVHNALFNFHSATLVPMLLHDA